MASADSTRVAETPWFRVGFSIPPAYRIVEDVRSQGDAAVIRYVRQFDAPNLTLEELTVSPREFAEAEKSVSRNFRSALNRAVSQIESFHRQQMPRSWMQIERPGTFLGQMVNKKVGVSAVFKTGSAWGIAALAYGTATLPKVDVIVGPGNLYVTLAKKLVAGTVGIDMIAGPSEVLVIADDTAEPDFAAADLLSQAEHDTLASAVLLTDSRDIAERVSLAVDRQLPSLSRREIAAESLQRYGAILVMPSLNESVALANRIAPEHLELHIADPFPWIGKIRNAGAVFMGDFTPEPMGDYIAGPNHVLPTAGTARFSSALSVDHFIKKTSIVHYSEEAFQSEAPDVVTLAEIEGLSAHAKAVRLRMEAPSKKQNRRQKTEE